MKEMEKISDQAKFTEVYHLIMKSAECFCRLSPSIPKALLEVQQHIHGSLDESAFHVLKAYESIATRKGMFQRYHGLHVARRWFDSLPHEITNNIRMESDTSVIWVGEKPCLRHKILTLEESI